MTYCHIPVPFDAPQPQQVKTFCRMLDALDGQRVFIHCIMNYRVSAFMYHYLTKVVKLSDRLARSEMFDRWQPDPVWTRVLLWSEKEIGL